MYYTNFKLLQDCGEFDGIQRIFFGSGLDFWLHRLLFLDAMSFLSHGRLSTSLQRYIQVDIDDIFVGQKGTRLTPSDVEVNLNWYLLLERNPWIHWYYILSSLICRASLTHKTAFEQLFLVFGLIWDTQESFITMGLMKRIKGMTIFCVSYNPIMFSPSYLYIAQFFLSIHLLERANEFTWFGHMWSHQQPHLYENVSSLEADMTLNKNFAIVCFCYRSTSYTVFTIKYFVLIL